MKSKIILSGLTALALSALSANACLVQVTISCPGVQGSAGKGIWVCLAGSSTGCQFTDDLGTATFRVPSVGTYKLCVDTSTLPPGTTLKPNCEKVDVLTEDTTEVDIFLSGSCVPVTGGCWMTGGGTIGTGKTPTYSYGGVVYPGCSPKAAEGGNWNVVAHAAGLHFQGQQIIVDGCSGVPTSSPKVTVNVIDYHGTGILSGIGGNPDATIPVTFVARAIDNHDGGAGADQLYLQVLDASNNVVLQIGNSAADPQTVSTGNIQIHQSSCGK